MKNRAGPRLWTNANIKTPANCATNNATANACCNPADVALE